MSYEIECIRGTFIEKEFTRITNLPEHTPERNLSTLGGIRRCPPAADYT